ncbi:hypothetical protein CLAIMM_03609 [Cladophialophora immunda]|nr:hypothetical protein CLAIMM_03609 [Cladophialophora immunda]
MSWLIMILRRSGDVADRSANQEPGLAKEVPALGRRNDAGARVKRPLAMLSRAIDLTLRKQSSASKTKLTSGTSESPRTTTPSGVQAIDIIASSQTKLSGSSSCQLPKRFIGSDFLTDFRCGDWRWGNMKQRCPRQPRIGETCGARLVDTDNLSRTNEDCKHCQEKAVKERRLQKERDNLRRWRSEGDRFAASIAKAEDERQARLVNHRVTQRVIRDELAERGDSSDSQPPPKVGL